MATPHILFAVLRVYRPDSFIVCQRADSFKLDTNWITKPNTPSQDKLNISTMPILLHIVAPSLGFSVLVE
jgi:hypothetical protein